ncbi:MAG: hypothetical protein U0441_04445 [Polyangiaceae bacterium]
MGARFSMPVVTTMVLLAAGCDGIGPPEIASTQTTGGHPGGSGGTSETTGGGGTSGGGTTDSPVSPVLVAIAATPASSSGEPTLADEIEADITTFGAGARAAVVSVPWTDALPLAPSLTKRFDFYAAHDHRVLVNLAVVDRLADLRPPEIAALPWSDADAQDAVHAALDALLDAGGAAVRFVTLGRDVDVYLAAHPSERAAFVAFAKEAAAYARSHAGAASDLAVGVAFSPDAPKSEPAFPELVDASDVLGFSYFPGLGTYETDATSGVVGAVTSLADAAMNKPIVLQAVGAPSDPLAGGADATQQAFFTTLFGAIGARRSAFALVSVTELHDAPASACAAWVASQGDAPDAALTAYACSLGVLTTDGTPKPAWGAVIAGAAALSTP